MAEIIMSDPDWTRETPTEYVPLAEVQSTPVDLLDGRVVPDNEFATRVLKSICSNKDRRTPDAGVLLARIERDIKYLTDEEVSKLIQRHTEPNLKQPLSEDEQSQLRAHLTAKPHPGTEHNIPNAIMKSPQLRRAANYLSDRNRHQLPIDSNTQNRIGRVMAFVAGLHFKNRADREAIEPFLKQINDTLLG